MALATRGSIIDLVASLGVTLSDSRCLLDLSAILDVSVCPVIDIYLPKPHTISNPSDDHCVVTPSKPKMMMERSASCQAGGSDKVADILAWAKAGLLGVNVNLYLNLLRSISAEIDIDLALLSILGITIDVDLNVGNVKTCKKHFAPQCGHKINVPPKTPNCKSIKTNTADDCLRECHKYAADLNAAANVKVGDLNVFDCTGISFDPLAVDTCLIVTLDNVLDLLVTADVSVDSWTRKPHA